MVHDPLKAQFVLDKELVEDNLEALHQSLERAVAQGMLDEDAHFYNELLDLIEDLSVISSHPELDEIVTTAKVLETDIDVFLSRQGQTTIGLHWPPPRNK